jgi:acetyl esterase/lipase
MFSKLIFPFLITITFVLLTACNGYTLNATPTLANSPSPTLGSTPPPVIHIDSPTPPPATRTRVTPTLAPIDVTKFGTIDHNITYCTMGKVALKLDLYYPKQSAIQPYPVAVNIHGGSWSFGDKETSETEIDIPELVQRGYVVAAIDYRLAPEYKFPAQIEDVKCAVRFLRANAATYHLDANRIGAWGCSAGGHLAALLGVTDPSNGFDHGEYTNQSSRVQAVAALSAPMDITLYDVVGRAVMLQHVFGTVIPNDPIFMRASPVTFVSKDDPPFLIIQGDKDNLIAPQHGEQMQAKLMAAGVSAELATVKEGHHCFPSQPTMIPSRDEISQQVADFFDKNLK